MMDASASNSPTAPADVVTGMWRALEAHDWESLKSYLAPDCLYVDMPLPAAGARGPEDIVKRLRLLFDRLARYEHHGGRMVADGVDVMYEHSETWYFPTGEQGTLRFATVHQVVDGKITVWKDYWDYAALASIAPPSYFDNIEDFDLSWMYDASALV